MLSIWVSKLIGVYVYYWYYGCQRHDKTTMYYGLALVQHTILNNVDIK